MRSDMGSNGPFASSERASPAEILDQLKQTRSAQQGPFSLDGISSPLAVINSERQVVFANRSFLEAVNARSVEELCGKRPGEILGCIHAGNGCGESESCRYCGAARAILETQTTLKEATRECHVSSELAGRVAAFDLQVHTTPFDIAGKPYVLITFVDISGQKRRTALERIFFHDILNTTSSFKLYLELLARGIKDEGNLSLMRRLRSICETLEEVIKGQKLILSAESHTLEVQKNLIESRALATQLLGQMEGLEISKKRSVVIAPFAESFSFLSDDSLVKRVLGNMLKNALEASPENGVVSLAFGKGEATRAWFSVHNDTFMPPEVQHQVFHRYFSTKGEGRGVGTWGMRLLAEEYLGGRIVFTSTQEEGTTFTLTLPA
jgi:nitrogen-specific signal transduction histidine kinase